MYISYREICSYLLRRCHGVRPRVRAGAVVGHVAAGDGVARGGEGAGVGVVLVVVVRIGKDAVAVGIISGDGQRAAATEFQRTVGKDGLIVILSGDAVRAADVEGQVAIAVDEAMIIIVIRGGESVDVDGASIVHPEPVAAAGAAEGDFGGIDIVIVIYFVGGHGTSVVPRDGGGDAGGLLGQRDGRRVVVVLAVLETAAGRRLRALVLIAARVSGGEGQLVAVATALVNAERHVDVAGGGGAEGDEIVVARVLIFAGFQWIVICNQSGVIRLDFERLDIDGRY